MTSTKPSVDRRQSALVLVVMAVMVAIGGWIAVGLFGYRQFFVMTSHWKWRDTTAMGYWRGEILFVESGFKFGIGPTGPYQVKAFHPQTGVVCNTGIILSGWYGHFVADRDQFWFVTPGEVVWSDGTTVTRHRPKLPVTQASLPFLLDGRLTAVAPDDNGHQRLYSFADGQWNAGRRIAIPGFGRKWEFDVEKGEERLVPRTTGSGVKPAGVQDIVQACQVGDKTHVVAMNHGKWIDNKTAYRLGFDFVEESTDAASALVPENSEPDTTGWYSLGTIGTWSNPTLHYIDGNLMLFDQGSLWKLDPSKAGKFVSTDLILGSLGRNIGVAVLPSGDDVYMVAISRLREVRIFHRVGSTYSHVPHSISGNATNLRAFEGTIVGLALAVWMLSHLILLGGCNRLVERWRQPQYIFGHEGVTLAPLARRFLARSVDLLIMLSPIGLVVTWLFAVTNDEQRDELYWWILVVVYDLVVNRDWDWGSLQGLVYTIGWLDHFQEATSGFLIAIVWAVGMFVLSVLVEGRTGAFVGKWLCGLRVVRTTLRPCSQQRILLRELLLCVDTANLLSPIPAVFAILSNEQRQRIGDLVADTIVVEHHPSTIDLSSSASPTAMNN